MHHWRLVAGELQTERTFPTTAAVRVTIVYPCCCETLELGDPGNGWRVLRVDTCHLCARPDQALFDPQQMELLRE